MFWLHTEMKESTIAFVIPALMLHAGTVSMWWLQRRATFSKPAQTEWRCVECHCYVCIMWSPYSYWCLLLVS